MEKELKDDLRYSLLSHLDTYGPLSLEEKGIRVSSDARYPGLYNLKYGSVLVDKADPIVQACRGAVVEETLEGFNLVAYAFDRFFNIGEPLAVDIDWSTAKVYEKYDGSLIKLFFWGGKWIVSTSGSVAGAGNAGTSEKSFEDLFWEAFYYLGYKKDNLDADNCYIFELCSSENRIVVKYNDYELRLLAVRNRRDNFSELPLSDFVGCFNIAESFDFGTWQLFEEANARGVEHEGFIVCDSYGNRVKIKSDLYVRLHRVRGNGEPCFSELYINDDLEEFLLHFPEYHEKFDPLVEKINDIGFAVESFVRLYSDLSQKEFAAIVLDNHSNVSGAMFGIRAGKYVNFKNFVERISPMQLDNLLGL